MSKTPATTPTDDGPRRNFLVELAAIVIGGVVAVVPLVAGLFVFLDPLRSRGNKAAAEAEPKEDDYPGTWLRVANLAAVPEDGMPKQFPVIADRIDAWNLTPNEPIGSVYLLREEKEGEEQIVCFNAVCPHAGCLFSVDDKSAPVVFRCPCHNSCFQLDGAIDDNTGRINPSPRGLDTLEVDPKLLAEGEVWVKYANFYAGEKEKKAKP